MLATGDTRRARRARVAFLDGRPVNPGEDSYYDLPGRSAEVATLYEHGVRAILHGLRFGEHGLPLMGSGDWNDGMNLVGIEGKGESVWLAFFLCTVLDAVREASRACAATRRSRERCDEDRAELAQNIEQHGWDGAWYRRAYFDDGTPLGSARNSECQIDSIAQSWSVLSGSRRAERARAAMDAVYTHLVRRDDALIQLLDAAVRHVDAVSRLHPRLRSRRARERRPVHARRDLGGDGVRGAGRRRRAPGS